MRRPKAILIVGGTGILGTHLALHLREGYKVYATYHRKRMSIPGVSFLPFNALDRNWIKRIVFKINPDIVIYTAGNEVVEWAESNPRDAERIYTSGAASVSTVAEVLQPKFIYLSNSYVFDGRRGNYHENDVVLPSTILGKVKVAGENFIKGRSLNYVIVRSSPIFGRGNGRALSFLDLVRNRLSQGEPIGVPNFEQHSFAPIYGLVELIVRLVEGGPRNEVLHYGGLTKLTHYEFATAFAKRFGYEPNLIRPVDAPLDEKTHENPESDYSLNSSRVAELLKLKPLLLEEGFDLLENKLSATW